MMNGAGFGPPRDVSGREEEDDLYGESSYATIKNILVSGIVVDVDCDAAQGGYFGGKLIEAGIVLPGGR